MHAVAALGQAQQLHKITLGLKIVKQLPNAGQVLQAVDVIEQVAWPRTIRLFCSPSAPDQVASPASTIFCVRASSSALAEASSASTRVLASPRVRPRMRALR